MNYTITLHSDNEEFWRFNILLGCSCRDKYDKQCGYVSLSDIIAPSMSNLASRPESAPTVRHKVVEAEECHHLEIYIEVIPHTLPSNDLISTQAPLTLDIKVEYGNSVLYYAPLEINAWGGASHKIIAQKE